MKARELEISVNGQTHQTKRYAEGDITILDANGNHVSTTDVVKAAWDAHTLADQQDFRHELNAALASQPTVEEIADEQHARRWAIATDDTNGNY